MTVQHHLSDELLLSYAAGGLSEGWSLAVATHLALCPDCRRRALAADAVGGALLDGIEPSPVDDASLEAVLGRIDAAADRPLPPSARPAAGDTLLPEPLRTYAGPELRWRRRSPSAHQIRIATRDRATTVRLLRIKAGAPMPVNGHRGTELTLVLQGAFDDAAGTFARGDIEEADEGVEHQPIAAAGEDCICLAVTDAPLRFRGVAALLQPFLRI